MNTTSITRRIGLIGLLCVAGSPLFALEFRVLSWSGSINDVRFRNGRAETVISGEETSLSPLYKVDGAGPLKLYRTLEKEEKAVEEAVATLPLPEGLTRALLMLSPVADAPGTYTGMWLDDAAEANPAGTLRVYNFTSRNLAVKAGDWQAVLAPKATDQFRFDPAARSLPVQVAARIGEAWQRVVNYSQPVRPRYHLLAIFRDGRPKPLQETALVDHVIVYDIPPAMPLKPAGPEG
jgi:hypothetical protein